MANLSDDNPESDKFILIKTDDEYSSPERAIKSNLQIMNNPYVGSKEIYLRNEIVSKINNL